MDAAAQRKASGDLVKRLTFNYQRWLVSWRKFGGSSDAPEARYVREQLRRVRRRWSASNG